MNCYIIMTKHYNILFYCIADWIIIQIYCKWKSVIDRDVKDKLTVCKKKRNMYNWIFATNVFYFIPFYQQ